MENKQQIDLLFKDLISEASIGKISFESKRFGNFIYNSHFFAEIENKSNNHNNDNEYPTLIIQDYNKLLDSLEKYVNLASPLYIDEKEDEYLTQDGYIKFLIYTLIANCSNYDCVTFNKYIENRIQMLEKIEPEGKILLPDFQNHKFYIQITQTSSILEAPNRFTPILENPDKSKFYLPTVTYGFYNDKAYIGAIQGEEEKQSGEAARKMDRYFRKLNSGVASEEIEGNVSPSFIASLTIFNAYLKSLNINKIVAPCFLPIRTDLPRKNLYKKHVKDPINFTQDWLNEKLEQKDRDQFNITNKFMYLFKRYCSHFTDSECYFDDHKQEMQTILKEQKNKTNNIIFQLNDFCFKSFLDYQNEK